eukprot:sb/3466664/
MYGARKCRHSNRLEHVINELSRFYEDKAATFISVDCTSSELKEHCKAQQIRKFPTLRFVYLGVFLKTEYRGERRVEPMKEFIDELIDHDIPILDNVSKLEQIRVDQNHRCVMGFFKSTETPEYLAYKKVSGAFHKQCYFYAFINEVQEVPVVAVRDFALGDDIFPGTIETMAIYPWIRDNCRPLVAEMTFENAEEMVEQNLPLLILYRNGSDPETVNTFTRAVHHEIRDLLNIQVVSVHVDGNVFKNALKIAKKSTASMPVVQLDTFKIYRTINNFNILNTAGSLRKFVQDTLEESRAMEEASNKKSIFERLKPSKSRYTFSSPDHDEL